VFTHHGRIIEKNGNETLSFHVGLDNFLYMVGSTRRPTWLAGGECDFVRNGRSMSPTLTDHTACPGLELLSCEHLAIQAAAAGLLLNVHKQLTTDNSE
jgi:hypothetical protein